MRIYKITIRSATLESLEDHEHVFRRNCVRFGTMKQRVYAQPCSGTRMSDGLMKALTERQREA